MPNTHGKDVIITTGSSGMLGSGVIDRLHDDYQIIGFDRDGQPQPPPEAECVLMDVTDPRSVDLALQRVRYGYGDHVAALVHMAAYYDFDGEDNPLYEQVTINGTKRLLEGIHSKTLDVEQFVFTSTMLVHEPSAPGGEPITEGTPLKRTWPYPNSKIDTEAVIHAHRGDTKVVHLRIAGVYDDWGGPPTLTHQIKRIYEKELQSHLYPADLSVGQNFVHIDDVLEAIRLTIRHRRELPDEVAILIGEPETLSYDRLQDTIGCLVHGKDAWFTMKVPPRLAKVGAAAQVAASKLPGVDEPFIKPWMVEHAADHYALDITRARELLGWEPKHRLEDKLGTIVGHLLADPEKFYNRNKLGEPPSSMPAPSADRNPEEEKDFPKEEAVR